MVLMLEIFDSLALSKFKIPTRKVKPIEYVMI